MRSPEESLMLSGSSLDMSPPHAPVQGFPSANDAPDSGMNAAICEEINRFNRYCDRLTFTMLGALAGHFRAVLNDGTPGLGKSRSTVEILKLLPRLTQVNVVQGHVSPSRLYQLLYQSRSKGSVIVIDESATIISNRDMQQLLRCTLYGGRVGWLGSKQHLQELDVPDTFTFQGAVVATQTVPMASVAVASYPATCIVPVFEIDVPVDIELEKNHKYWIVFQPHQDRVDDPAGGPGYGQTAV